MKKYPIYFIVALVFLGVVKLIQVALFNADEYSKNKKASFSDPVEKVKPKTLQKKAEQKQPILTDTTTTSASPEEVSETAQAGEESFQTEEPKEESSNPSNGSDITLSDLKNNYLAIKIANLPQGQLREDVVIRYYKHEKDGNKVYPLKKLGYYIHEKEANETQGLGSNVLYYGGDVNIEDIQIVAFTLLANGLPIKSIERSQFEWKSNAIEIGTDTLLLDAANLTNQEIANFIK
ncbi:hypothetical protein [Ekhidna sp.]|uniref:hypothetical protein n=2 Tax=Ekhidna sp. TaxID=2608089 RepID=UPI00329A64D9